MKTKAKLTIVALLSGLMLLTVPLLGKGKPGGKGGGKVPGMVTFLDASGDVVKSDRLGDYVSNAEDVSCYMFDNATKDDFIYLNVSSDRFIDYLGDPDTGPGTGWLFRTTGVSGDGDLFNMPICPAPGSSKTASAVLLFEDRNDELHWPLIHETFELCISIVRMSEVDWCVSGDCAELILWANLSRKKVASSVDVAAPFALTFTADVSLP